MPEAAAPVAQPAAPLPVPGAAGALTHEQRAALLVNALWKDSSPAAALMRSKAKEMFPDVVTPEDTINPVMAPMQARLDETLKQVKDLTDAIAARDKKAEEDSLNVSFEQAVTSARQKFNLTDAGFDKMIARMKETKNYTDAEAAASWVVSSEPPPAAPGPTWGPRNASIFGGQNGQAEDKVKKLLSDPLGYQDAELNEFIRDPDKYVRDTFGVAA